HLEAQRQRFAPWADSRLLAFYQSILRAGRRATRAEARPSIQEALRSRRVLHQACFYSATNRRSVDRKTKQSLHRHPRLEVGSSPNEKHSFRKTKHSIAPSLTIERRGRESCMFFLNGREGMRTLGRVADRIR